MNQELPAVQAEFRKGRGTRDQIANIWHRWLIEKAREFQKNIYFFFIDYAKPLTVCITTNCPKIFQAMGIPEHLTCLLRNLCAGQEAVVRTGHGTTDWFKIEKEVQGLCCHPAYLTYMQSTSYEMQGWMNHKLESRLPGEISAQIILVSDMQMLAL